MPQVAVRSDLGAAAVGGRVYLDNQASTAMDPAAASRMRQVAEEVYANPASSHRSGRRAAEVVERARRLVADAVHALPEEIVFTSGATESNNLALLGVARAAAERGDRRRGIVTLPLEHPSVLAPARHLESLGFRLRLAPVGPDGRVLLDELDRLLEDEVLLVSIQAANNEIGTIQPLSEAAELARRRGVLVHSDAAQALGKVPFSVEALGLDFASLSAHKCYGPKGAGALFVRGGVRSAPIAPITFGGGQERGLRPGTPNTPAIAGFGEAAAEVPSRLGTEAPRLSRLRDQLEARLLARRPDARVNGARSHRTPNATSITFPGTDADALIANLREFDLSNASACRAGSPEPSHVLRAIGLSDEDAYATLRLALGPTTTEEEIPAVADRIADGVLRLSRLATRSPEREREPAAPRLPQERSGPDPILILNARGIRARGRQTPKGFLVLKGSQAHQEEVPSAAAYIREERRALVGQGHLVPSGNKYRLTKDHLFRSSSAASCVLAGSNLSGPAHWKTLDGQTLWELEKERRRDPPRAEVVPPPTSGKESAREDRIPDPPRVASHSVARPPEPSGSGQILFLRGKGIRARGRQTPAGFLVLADSEAHQAETPSASPSLRRRRRDLMARGLLVPADNKYRLTKDQLFGTSSSAAEVMLGRKASGPLSWKTEDGLTLKELEEERHSGRVPTRAAPSGGAPAASHRQAVSPPSRTSDTLQSKEPSRAAR